MHTRYRKLIIGLSTYFNRSFALLRTLVYQNTLHIALLLAHSRSFVSFSFSAPSLFFFSRAVSFLLFLSCFFSLLHISRSVAFSSLLLYLSSFFLFASSLPLHRSKSFCADLSSSPYLSRLFFLPLSLASSHFPLLLFFSFPSFLLLFSIFRAWNFLSQSQRHRYLQSASLTAASVGASPPPRVCAKSAIFQSTTDAPPVADSRQRRLRSYLFERVTSWHAVKPAGTLRSPIVLPTTEFRPRTRHSSSQIL